MSGSEWIAAENERWIVEQCRSCPLPGYLIVRAKVPASRLGEPCWQRDRLPRPIPAARRSLN